MSVIYPIIKDSLSQSEKKMIEKYLSNYYKESSEEEEYMPSSNNKSSVENPKKKCTEFL